MSDTVDIVKWTETLGPRFLSKCRIGHNLECWEWTASRYSNGYGKFRVSKKWVGAHRISLQATGVDVTGWFVLHNCDNPACVNPNHLRAGDHSENMRDRARRKRYSQTGEASNLAILTDKKVLEIRKRYADILRYANGRVVRGEWIKLRREFGVSDGCLRHAAKGESWSHIK